MTCGFDHLQELERQIQSMSRTESPAALFNVLRDACRLSAPRGSVFLVRQGRIHGWSAFGYEPAVVEAQRRFRCGITEGWLGALASAADRATAERRGEAPEPDFGQPAPSEAVASVVRIQGKPVALLVIERQADESPWHPEANGLLVSAAQLRLELDLALRKLQSTQASLQAATSAKAELRTSAAEDAPSKPTPAPPTAEALRPATEFRAEPAAETSAAPKDEPTDVSPLPDVRDNDAPDLEAARRYARLVATDIRLYNEEAVVLGRRNGDLDRRLEEHLDRGKETFLRRHGDLGPTGLDLLHEAYVQVLAAGDAKLIPPSVVH